MGFNPDPTKQAQEVIFSRKSTKKIHLKICFNNIPVSKGDSQKHLGLYLGSKLFFDIHIKTIFTKVDRTIGFTIGKNFNKFDYHLQSFHKTTVRFWRCYL